MSFDLYTNPDHVEHLRSLEEIAETVELRFGSIVLKPSQYLLALTILDDDAETQTVRASEEYAIVLSLAIAVLSPQRYVFSVPESSLVRWLERTLEVFEGSIDLADPTNSQVLVPDISLAHRRFVEMNDVNKIILTSDYRATDGERTITYGEAPGWLRIDPSNEDADYIVIQA